MLESLPTPKLPPDFLGSLRLWQQPIPTPQPRQPKMHLAGIPVYEVEGMKGFAIVSLPPSAPAAIAPPQP